jgi:ketosteroid isomerase-like protein
MSNETEALVRRAFAADTCLIAREGAADLYRVRNGRIVAITTFESHEQALEAAGLSE